MKHSVLAPSSANRWGKCPGSLTMCRNHREVRDTSAADEGTAAHWVAEKMFMGEIIPPLTKAPNGVEVTNEMLEHAETYCNCIREQVPDPQHISLETKVQIDQIHPECFGTVDAHGFHNDTLFVFDYKYGRKPVKAKDNTQLTCYIAGLLYKYGAHPDLKVVAVIVQPRAFKEEGVIDTWVTSMRELALPVAHLSSAATEALSPHPRTLTGSHCLYCSGKLYCKSFMESVDKALVVAGETVDNDATPEILGKQLMLINEAHSVLSSYKSSLESSLIEHLKEGVFIPDWSVVNGQGNRRWSVSESQLKKKFGAKIFEKKVMSPAKAEKIVGKEVVKDLVERPVTAAKLVAAKNVECPFN